MSAAALFEDEVDALAKVAPMLERVQDSATRKRLVKLDQMLTSMEQQGYEIGVPRRVHQPTKRSLAEWHIPITRGGNRCALSFFINEDLPNEVRTSRGR